MLGKMAKHTCCQSDTWFIDLSEEEMRNTLSKFHPFYFHLNYLRLHLQGTLTNSAGRPDFHFLTFATYFVT